MTLDEFDGLFAAEARERGYDVPGKDIIALLAGDLRPQMVEALRRISERLITGCITNNVKAGEGAGMARSPEKVAANEAIMKMFQVVIQSSVVGVRKPNPKIYEMACEALNVAPEEVVYLDDLGINLKPARAMGMQTIKVIDPDVALDELEAAVGFDLR